MTNESYKGFLYAISLILLISIQTLTSYEIIISLYQKSEDSPTSSLSINSKEILAINHRNHEKTNYLSTRKKISVEDIHDL
jgi:hypothetical protein